MTGREIAGMGISGRGVAGNCGGRGGGGGVGGSDGARVGDGDVGVIQPTATATESARATVTATVSVLPMPGQTDSRRLHHLDHLAGGGARLDVDQGLREQIVQGLAFGVEGDQ
jgi:hypothetical protein